MSVKTALPILILGAAMLAASGCATKEDLAGYATKSELAALRAELMREVKKAQDSARSSAAASERAAKEARDSADKADAIFRKSVRK